MSEAAMSIRRPGDAGFTLIEMLVVIIIVGILAAIAIPLFMMQRDRAWRSMVVSDLRNGAVIVESYYADNGDYSASGPNDLLKRGFDVSPGVIVSVYISGDGQSFCMHGHHQSIGTTPIAAIYSRQEGGFTEDLTSCDDLSGVGYAEVFQVTN
jgi:type IV pilus assembly protein PilA